MNTPKFTVDKVYMDRNGNKTIKIITIGSNSKLTIQTNGNLPLTHRDVRLTNDGVVLNSACTAEINQYIEDYFNGFKK